MKREKGLSPLLICAAAALYNGASLQSPNVRSEGRAGSGVLLPARPSRLCG